MEPSAKYAVSERILIDANIETVWRHMTDWDAYPQWNPFIVKVEFLSDRQVPNSKMKFHLRWQDGKTGTSIEQMARSVPPQNGTAELAYTYASLPARLGLLRATRVQRLRQIGSQTEYVTREEFHGILARFVPFTAVQQGFTAQAEALARVSAGR